MRVAVFVVFVSMLATASEASQSCMTRTEARQHLGSVHIYWHGADHCWDATSTRRYHRIRHVHEKTDHQVQQKIDYPRWHESMSQMLPGDEEPVQTSWIDRWVNIEQSTLVARWVDIVQVAAPSVIEGESEPTVTARSVVMAILALTLTLAIGEFLIIGIRLAGSSHRRD
jgi:hypothetical protein